MPEIKQIYKHFSNNPDFAFLSVSVDSRSTAQKLLETVRRHGIRYPVLHVSAEDGWNDGAFDWEIPHVPSAYIIDPQGNIFADVYPQAGLIETFDWLAAQDAALPPVGLSAISELQDDGSVLVTVQLANPGHQPLEVSVKASKVILTYDPVKDKEGTGEPNVYDNIDIEGLDLDFTQDFDEFGEASRSFVIPAQDGAAYISYEVSTAVPGMEALNGGAGFKVSSGGNVKLPQPQDAALEE